MINIFITMLVFYAIVFMLFGVKELSKREVNIARFNQSIYQKAVTDEPKKKKQNHVFKMPWDKATPVIILGGIGLGIIIYSITGVIWMSVISSLGGLLVPKLLLEVKLASEKNEIDKGMEQATETIATVMRSGGGLADAFERAALDSKQPLSGYLMEASTRVRTGMSQADAMARFQQRVPLKELNIITVGMRLSNMGMPVNMPEMFFEAQKKIRDRLAFNREIRVLVAENKIAAWVVTIMPIFILSFIRQMAPEIVDPLFTTTLGIIIFCFCTSFIAIGIYIIMQIIKPKE